VRLYRPGGAGQGREAAKRTLEGRGTACDTRTWERWAPHTWALIDNVIEQRIADCVAADLDRSMLAHVLGVDRSTLYRRYITSARKAVMPTPAGRASAETQ